jgi:hypothetical protein
MLCARSVIALMIRGGTTGPDSPQGVQLRVLARDLDLFTCASRIGDATTWGMPERHDHYLCRFVRAPIDAEAPLPTSV